MSGEGVWSWAAASEHAGPTRARPIPPEAAWAFRPRVPRAPPRSKAKLAPRARRGSPAEARPAKAARRAASEGAW
eukprot:7077289-Alexandrium_andersonii.AAC.1